MNARQSTTLGLASRQAALVTLLGALAMIWSGIGLWQFASQSVEEPPERRQRYRLHSLATLIELSYARSGDANLQAILHRGIQQGDAMYGYVVASDGTFLAHSDPSFIGQDARSKPVFLMNSDQLDAVKLEVDGVEVREYSTPLVGNGTVLGTLHLGFPQPTWFGHASATLVTISFWLFGPFLVSIATAVFVFRDSQRFGAITRQLARLARRGCGIETNLEPVAATGAVSIGWNHLVEQANSHQSTDPLIEKIETAAAGLDGGRTDRFLEWLPEGIATTDANGRLNFANRACRALLDAEDSDDEISEQALESLLGIDKPNGDCSSTKPTVREVTRVYSGGQRILRVARHCVRANSPSDSSGYIWSIRDVSQQKLVEKMRDDFLDSATHELRTPLANIKAYAETLALSEMLEVEQQKEFCNTINSEATRLARLIDDLLSISSMEVGSLSISKQNVEVRRLLEDVVQHIRPTMESKDLTFNVKLSERLPEMALDKDKVTTVLVNLLGNAAKYTPSGGSVNFVARWEDDHLVVDVEDTGLGIAKDELDKVFDKFFRSADERVQDITGTGLGLSLVQELVRLHGGTISVESEVNVGSRFTVVLPKA